MCELEVCILMCCLWMSVVVSLLTSTPPLLPLLPLLHMTSVYVLVIPPTPHPHPPSLLVSAVPIAPHSGLEGRHRGPQCPLWNHRPPNFASHQNSYPPPPPIPHHCPPDPCHAPVSPPHVGVEGGKCTVVTITLHPHWPPPPNTWAPTHALCVCAVRSPPPPPPPKKRKRGLDGL